MCIKYSFKHFVALCSVVVFSMIGLSRCTGGYTFTGASIPPDAKTISIQTFPNYAPLVNPQLSQILSDGMRNAFASQTSLNLVNNGGDLDIKGEITGYTMQPTAITGNDQAAMNRLTITIKVVFVNTTRMSSRINRFQSLRF